MAPKGGGGRGGGGGSSSSDSSSSSGSSSIWLQKTETLGSGWTDGLSIALIVFVAIWSVVLIAIRFWAVSKRKRFLNTEIWKHVMSIKAWKPAIWFGIIFYLFSLISSVIEENETVVAAVYYLIRFIILSVGFLAEIFTLVAIYSLLNQLLLHPNGANDAKASLKGKVFLAHVFFCAILILLYLVYFAYGMKVVVESVERYGSADYALFVGDLDGRDVDISNSINLAYEAIYFVLSVEILAISIFLLLTASKRDFPQKTAGYLVGLVAIPLFVRKIFILAFTARAYSGYGDLTLPAIGAEAFIVGAANMMVYAGIVAVVCQIAGLTSRPWSGAPPNGPAAPMMQHGTMPPQQFAPAQPYPQQPMYGAPQQYPTSPMSQQQYGAPSQFSSPPSTVYSAPQGRQPMQQQYSPPPHQQPYYPPPSGAQAQAQYGVPQEVKPYNAAMPQAQEMPQRRH